MNLAEALLHGLRAYGASEIFGIPGDFALALFKVIEESRILPLYTLSHEPAVGFAADAAARLHVRPSVAAVTYGAGALNMVNPIAAAYAEKSPVVVLSGGPGIADRATGLLLHHQAKRLSSQIEIYREVTCDQAILDDVASAPQVIARLLRACVTQSRPVYLEVPRDRVFDACDPVPRLSTTVDGDADAVDACTDEIVAQLAAARSPVLVVGVEVRRFGLEPEVARLARTLGIPVATSFMGRGLLAGEDVPLQGTYLGVAGDPELTRLVESSDALILLGVILSDTNFGISRRKIDLRRSILAVDGQVSLGYHVYPDLPLRALVEALERKGAPGRRVSTPAPLAYPRGLEADGQPITPTDIAKAVNDLFDRHGLMPIAADTGDCLFTALDMDHTALVAPGYYATMGFGVPAGLGLQAASGRRPLILVGDGAFQMTGWELLHCARYGWNPIVLVFNNASWEMLRGFQPESAFNDLPALNFAAIAGVLGGHGRRVTTRAELQEALDAAFGDDSQFQLLDIVLPRGVMSRTLSRFVEGIKTVRADSRTSSAR
jgi:indolepyruvate decarboxylase